MCLCVGVAIEQSEVCLCVGVAIEPLGSMPVCGGSYRTITKCACVLG